MLTRNRLPSKIPYCTYVQNVTGILLKKIGKQYLLPNQLYELGLWVCSLSDGILIIFRHTGTCMLALSSLAIINLQRGNLKPYFFFYLLFFRTEHAEDMPPTEESPCRKEVKCPVCMESETRVGCNSFCYFNVSTFLSRQAWLFICENARLFWFCNTAIWKCKRNLWKGTMAKTRSPEVMVSLELQTCS